MAQHDGAARIANLIKRFKPSDNTASFRNAFREAVSTALASNAIDKEGADLLGKVRSCVESWASKSPPTAADAYRQWNEIYQAGRELFSPLILEAMLARFPKTAKKGVDWSSFVLADTDERMLHVLVTRGHLRKADLLRLAKAHPSDFYRSAALDLLLRQRTAAPRAVWEPLIEGESRPAGLQPGPDALIASFDFDSTKNAEAWLLECLARVPAATRSTTLRSTLARPPSAYRFATYLSPPPGPSAKARSKGGGKTAGNRAELLLQWVEVCSQALERGGNTAGVASIVLGFFQLGITANPQTFDPEQRAALLAAISSVVERTLIAALKNAETSGADAARPFMLLVGGDQMYKSVQEYLRRLPVGVKDELEAPERALRFERYQGRREIVQGLLSALDGVPDEGPLRDAVEAVLFNAGVRPVGTPGDQVSFDTHSHQAETSGILPGDPVVVARSGQRLGTEADGIVLIKARVKGIER